LALRKPCDRVSAAPLATGALPERLAHEQLVLRDLRDRARVVVDAPSRRPSDHASLSGDGNRDAQLHCRCAQAPARHRQLPRPLPHRPRDRPACGKDTAPRRHGPSASSGPDARATKPCSRRGMDMCSCAVRYRQRCGILPTQPGDESTECACFSRPADAAALRLYRIASKSPCARRRECLTLCAAPSLPDCSCC
jgi:hypothetical protein